MSSEATGRRGLRASRGPRARRRLAGLLLASFVLAGCYEIPPELPSDPARPDGPSPVAVYNRDPFAAENRWFARSFKLGAAEARGSRGARPTSGAAEPLAFFDQLEIVDLAELTALSEEVLGGPRARHGSLTYDCRERVARVLFHCDVLALRAAMTEESAALSPLALELQRALKPVSELLREEFPEGVSGSECWAPPPPLRRRGWRAVGIDLPAGLRPSPADLRGTRVLRLKSGGNRVADAGGSPGDRRSGSSMSVLLRRPVARDYAGGPVLLEFANECWMLERTGDDVAATVWRLDRAASLAGEEAWRRLAPDEEFSIRDPLVENGEWVTGTTESLCLGCHREPGEGATERSFVAMEEEQLERAREIFDAAGLGRAPPE